MLSQGMFISMRLAFRPQRSVAEQLHTVTLSRIGTSTVAKSSREKSWFAKREDRETDPHRARQELLTEERNERVKRLEAVLFLSREPLNSRKLAQHADLSDGTQARTLMKHLNQLYDRDQQAFRIEHVAGGYQLMTRPRFAKWLQRLSHVPQEWRLSEPAIETLAVVAYRQPVLRADIESIRGVACGEILRQLMERDLVRIGGRSEDLGRPYLYTTTRRFLQIFGLATLDKLPRAEEMRSAESAVDEVRHQEESNVTVTFAEKPTSGKDQDEIELKPSTVMAIDEEEDEDYEYEDDDEVDDEEDEDEDESEEYDDDDDDDDFDDFDDDDDDDEEEEDDDFDAEGEWEEVEDEDDEWEDEDDEWEVDEEDEEDDEEWD